MENNQLNNLWNAQDDNAHLEKAEDIITKAKHRRRAQVIGIIVMSCTVLILFAYTIYVLPNQWNDFSLGLVLMMGSLLFRIVLEMISIQKKKSKLISMDARSYRSYLKKYYKKRIITNYVITPLCFLIYLYGFYLLLPYFKDEFSEGFYTYILISGIISLIVVAVIIINGVLKEHRFLKKIKD